MEQLREYCLTMAADDLEKIVISKPVNKTVPYQKIVVERKKGGYQIARYTDKQVFHENIAPELLGEKCSEMARGQYLQVNGWGVGWEHVILMSRKGACSYKRKQRTGAKTNAVPADHNRKKQYLLEEGQAVAPLVDMGIFTKDGKVVRSMYDKYRQINRFLEILDDEIGAMKVRSLNVIDFGCGKSYLTFVVYHYLTQIKKIEAHIIGLDLKADVIEKCNRAAETYGYSGLRFELGDINGYHAPFDVDLVMTLHACDTATDYALYNAITWKAKLIFSVPCCQHELNQQIRPQHLDILSRYGIIKERFSALSTDAIRGNLLEYCGYKTQLLEFIDFAHTPKNILIRAVRRPGIPRGIREKALAEVRQLMEEFRFQPTLYSLLGLPGSGTEPVCRTEPMCGIGCSEESQEGKGT